MKNISLQYQDLQEGKMNKHQFLRNARMMFPNHVTQFNSFEDSVKILKNKGLLNEGDAVKGTPDKAPTYDYPNEETKYMKVVQEPEVQEQDGIYPATTLTDIPKEKMDKPVKDKSDGLEPIKPHDTKNEMKKIRIVKESKKILKENQYQATLNGKPIDMSSIEIDGVEMFDYPDFVDAYITYAEYEDGTPLEEDELMALTDQESDLVHDMAHESIRENKSLEDRKAGEVEKRDIGTPVQSFLKKTRDQVQGGPPTKQNVLKTKIKEIVSEILAEMYDTEYAEFSTDTERFNDDTPRSMSGMIDDVVDEFIEYKKANDLDLADDATDDELEDVIYYYLDRMGRNLNDDYYNVLFYGVRDELKRQGINFA